MTPPSVSSKTLPGLYQSADTASLEAQFYYFVSLGSYLLLLVLAALASFLWPKSPFGTLVSAGLFLVTLGVLIALRVKKPDDVWYNGRAVAESVKTRSWRWMMRADPFQGSGNDDIDAKQFINDLKAILSQNKSLSNALHANAGINDPISQEMWEIRRLTLDERLEIYKSQRITNQANWYSLKSIFNKRRARQWFFVSVGLHATAICLLLLRIRYPETNLPIEVIATAAGATLTWLQAKKHNELTSSYSLTAHEIVLIKGEALSVNTEEELSDFVVGSEAAFSREHTQWAARRPE